MKIKTMQILNIISAVSFFLSSASLLIIPFIKYDKELPVIAYVIALIFWMGLVVGLCIQILLAIKCKRLNLKSNSKKHRILYIIATIALALIIIFAVLNNKNSLLVVICLFVFLLSLQEAIVIKRKGCLN